MSWQNEYVRLLGCVDPKELDIEEAMRLKNINIPAKLYKYRPASDYALENLRTDTVWLNKPSEYNDPFEFAEYLDFDRINQALKAQGIFDGVEYFSSVYPLPAHVVEVAKSKVDPLLWVAEYVLRENGRSESNIDMFKEAIRYVLDREHSRTQEWKINLMQNNMKVSSFCESPDQLLMWSHYAAFHTGFCVEYSIESWPLADIRRRLLHPVFYSETRFDATDHLIQSFRGQGIINPLYSLISGATKSKEWAYEKEWRLIFNIGNSFPQQNYNMNCQTKVYLGYRISPENQKKVISICQERRIPVVQATLSPSHYKLDYIDVEH